MTNRSAPAEVTESPSSTATLRTVPDIGAVSVAFSRFACALAKPACADSSAADAAAF